MRKTSAGILLHRPGPEVFLVHPGGPFWAKKDLGAWSIPKGEYEPGEDPEAAARREFAEEVGAVPTGPLVPLGTFKQPGGKIVLAFALAGDFDPAALVSNTFELQWPPRSGRTITVPEVDRAAWFDLDAAREKLLVGQRPILDEFAARVPQP
jgi:predicted NUDIX family NTP pyrophosphohydrolase